ncbi:MAG: hypothetical protein JNL67_10105 [Planctomycetaceae bacterium]|nr:hypothetical protein [Planctomycetaceae bacterium]
MVQLRCFRSGFASVATVLQIAGSASLFGWPLLLPPAKFPSPQETAPAQILVESAPQVSSIAILPASQDEASCTTQECPTTACPTATCPTATCSPENMGKLQELMALRARVGTNIGSPEDFQTALASLIEQEQSDKSREAMPALIPSAPQGPHPNSVPWSAPPTNAHPSMNIHPPTQGQPSPHAQPVPHGQPSPHWQQPVPPQSPVLSWSQVPPYGSFPPSTFQPSTIQGHGQPLVIGNPHMIVPNQFAMPPQFAPGVPPHLPQPPVQRTENSGEPRSDMSPQQFVPRQADSERMRSPSVQSSIGDDPARVSSNEWNQDARRRQDRQIDDMVRTNQRPSLGPDQSHRVRQAARRLEEAAWDLEDVGEYSMADELRRKASELYQRARHHSPGHQNLNR